MRELNASGRLMMIGLTNTALHETFGCSDNVMFLCFQAMAGATATCTSVGNAHGCAEAKSSAKAFAKAHAKAFAAAWAQAVVKCGKCKVQARAKAAGSAALEVKLFALAEAAAQANVCVYGVLTASQRADWSRVMPACHDSDHCAVPVSKP
jgi:hypothetical protein